MFSIRVVRSSHTTYDVFLTFSCSFKASLQNSATLESCRESIFIWNCWHMSVVILEKCYRAIVSALARCFSHAFKWYSASIYWHIWRLIDIFFFLFLLVFVFIVFGLKERPFVNAIFVIFTNSLTAIIHNVPFGKIANSFRASYPHIFIAFTDNQYIMKYFSKLRALNI